MSFEVVFLGSGTSQGVPVIGVTYPAAFLANPKNHRLRPSIMLQTDQTRFVVDTPPDFRTQMLRESVDSLDAVLFTHAHADHIMGLDDCRRFCDPDTGDGLPIYASATTLDALRRVFFYAFTDHSAIPRGYLRPASRIIDGPFTVGDVEVVPVSLPHGRMESTGFLFRQNGRPRCAYLTDCQRVPEDVVELVRGAPVVILDALRKEPHPTHMCLDEALTAARRVRAERVFLTHLTDAYDHDRDQEELPEGVSLAYDGLRVTLS